MNQRHQGNEEKNFEIPQDPRKQNKYMYIYNSQIPKSKAKPNITTGNSTKP